MAVTIKGFASDWSVPEPAKQSLATSFATLDAQGRQPVRKGELDVSAADFGAVGDGIADDTAALQAFLTYIAVNKKAGFMPGVNYRITSTLIIPSRPGWTLRGSGNRATLITQDTDNIPIIQLGDAAGSQMNHFRMEKFWLTYKNFQPSTNTNAIGIYHYDMAWEAVFEDIGFKRGYYGSVVRAGVGCPWGTSWENIHFGNDLSGGAMHWHPGVNSVPNNRFGRMFVELGPMVGPVFTLRGYNMTIDTIEFIHAATDTPKLFSFASGMRCEFGTFKVENSPITTAKQLIDVAGDSYLNFGHITWNAGTMGPVTHATGNTFLFAVGTGSSQDSRVRIGELDMNVSTGTTSTGIYAFRAGAPDVSFHVDRLRLRSGWRTTDLVGNPVAATVLTVGDWSNGRATSRGDVNTTIALRDPNINRFTTAFTAPRTITLPSDGYHLHGGLYYDLIFDGAINGTNTATIKAGATTYRVQSTDKVALRYTWMGTSGANGWALTSYQTLP